MQTTSQTILCDGSQQGFVNHFCESSLARFCARIEYCMINMINITSSPFFFFFFSEGETDFLGFRIANLLSVFHSQATFPF